MCLSCPMLVGVYVGNRLNLLPRRFLNRVLILPLLTYTEISVAINILENFMFKIFVLLLASFLLTSCGGVLSYEHNDKVFLGPLEANDLNVMKSSGELQSKQDFQKMAYGIDSSGKFVGVCRSRVWKTHNNSDGERVVDEPAKMDFNVYNSLRLNTITVEQAELATGIDNFRSNTI